LAVEVISPGNTREEMQRKRGEDFGAGVRLVWYVYPRPREVHVYTAPDRWQVLSSEDNLEDSFVLPGFSVPLATLFGNPAK
jgi:Uma2 family endonuclease